MYRHTTDEELQMRIIVAKAKQNPNLPGNKTILALDEHFNVISTKLKALNDESIASIQAMEAQIRGEIETIVKTVNETNEKANRLLEQFQ